MAKATKQPESVETEYEEREETALAKLRAGDEGIIAPGDVGSMERLFDAGFVTERTFKIGDPTDNGIPVYFGEIVGQGPDVPAKTPDGKESMLPTWLWNPVNIKTLEPNRRILDTIISSHQVHAKTLKLHTMAQQQGGKGQALIQWVGMMRIKGGRTLNDVDFSPRVVK